MTEHFCDDLQPRCGCRRRARCTPAWRYDDAVDLRGPLRAGGADAVVGAIRGALAGKRAGHTFQLIGLGGPRKAMVQIGG